MLRIVRRPADTRARLKRAGFKWAPTVGAWQRHASAGARALALKFIEAKETTMIDPGETNENAPSGAPPPTTCACERGGTCDVSHDPMRCPCRQCSSATAEDRIARLREAVAAGSLDERLGVDVQTANAIVTVWDNLTPHNRVKMAAMSTARMGSIAWQVLSRTKGAA